MDEKYKQQLFEQIEEALKVAEKSGAQKWRELALQFDEHRMQAISLLKYCAERLPAHEAAHIKKFLNAPPLPGKIVLEKHLSAMMQQARVSDGSLGMKKFERALNSLHLDIYGTNENIHTRLRAARLAKKLSMQKLAELVDVSWQTIQQWEKNPSEGKKATAPKRDRLLIVADVLGVSVDFLLFGRLGDSGAGSTKAL